MIKWMNNHQNWAVFLGAFIGAALPGVLYALACWISDMEPIYRYRRWRNHRKDTRS